MKNLKNKMKHHSISLIILLMTFFQSCSDSESVSLYFDENSTVISFGMTSLIEKLDQSGYVIEKIGSENQVDNEIMIIHPEADYNQNIQKEMYDHVDDVSHDGFKIIKQDRKIFILGGSERGCQYGIFEVVEQIKTDPDINHIMEKEIDPALSFRAIKFNLPWAPYRPGPATEIHEETCRDLKFWESFLDMMVENRFNALSLWSTHIFPYMIRSKNYPEATPTEDGELNEWRSFLEVTF